MDTKPTPKEPVVGRQMLKALSLIRRKPGILDVLVDRQLGGPITDRLLNAKLIRFEPTDLGRKLYVLTSIYKSIPVPVPGHTFKGAGQDDSKEKIIMHNILAVLCPVCEMPAGKLCRSLKNNQEVRFPHGGRRDEAIYVMAVLINLYDHEQK